MDFLLVGIRGSQKQQIPDQMGHPIAFGINRGDVYKRQGLYYAVGADVIGGLLAAILGMMVLKNVLNSPSMWYFTLRFTLVPALFIAAIYLILAAIIPVVVLHFFNKGSVVERLRTVQ